MPIAPWSGLSMVPEAHRPTRARSGTRCAACPERALPGPATSRAARRHARRVPTMRPRSTRGSNVGCVASAHARATAPSRQVAGRPHGAPAFSPSAGRSSRRARAGRVRDEQRARAASRRSQSRSSSSVARAAPSAPPRCSRRSVQSRHERSSGRRACSSSSTSTPKRAKKRRPLAGSAYAPSSCWSSPRSSSASLTETPSRPAKWS